MTCFVFFNLDQPESQDKLLQSYSWQPLDPIIQITWLKQREICIDASIDAGVAEFNLNLSLDYIPIDSILYLLAPSSSQPTMVNTATIERGNCGADQHCCL